jgi:hypothetical protein
MTVHRNRFLVNKTNTCTEFQLYCYYYSTCFGQPFCSSSEFLAVHRLWYILCSCGEPFGTRSRMELQSSSILLVGILCICWFYSQGILLYVWQLYQLILPKATPFLVATHFIVPYMFRIIGSFSSLHVLKIIEGLQLENV